MAKTNFLPSKHGFHFPNGFVNHVIGNAITTVGRCGGMAFGSLDYYFHNIPVPTCDINDFPGPPAGASLPNHVPPDGTPLADYIYQRLMDSLTLYGLSAINWYLHSDHSTWLAGPGIVWACKNQEWPKLKAHLDQGAPTVLQLITASGGIGDCHQVVAYDYALGANSITISIYDNNYPDNDQVTISSTVDDTNPHWNEANGGAEIWRAFFCEDGTEPATYGAPLVSGTGAGGAPPPFADITLSVGIQPTTSEPFVGQPFQCSFSVRNNGPYPAHAQYLFLSATAGPNTARMTATLGADTTSPLNLAPGASYTMTKNVPALNVPPGNYTIAASYINLQGQPIENMPAAGGLSLTTGLTVLASLTAQISVLDETASVVQSVGTYAIRVSATFQPSQFTPTSVHWVADPGTPYQHTSDGNPAMVEVEVGPSGGPYVYQHTVQVVASNAAGDQVTASIPLTIPEPTVVLQANYQSPYTKVAASERVVYGHQSETIEACSEVLVVATAQGLFSPISYGWTPQPTQVLAGGAEVVAPMKVVGDPTKVWSYQGQNVALNVKDAIGQSATATLAVVGDIIIGHIIYPPPGIFPPPGLGRGPEPARGTAGL